MTDRLLGLLIEFDEMGFSPTTVCEEPEGYAIKWKELLLEEIQALESDNVSLRNEADENAALSMESKMRADRLEAENAALRERLEKAVELPVKLGDTVFFFDFNKNKVQQGKVIGIRWNYFTPSNPIWVIVQYDIPMIKRDCDIEVWLSMVFTTREAAFARLAELKGGEK